MTTHDRIEHSTLLKAPRSRVWRALTDAPEFGRWFMARLDGQQFIPGERTRGPIAHPGYEHIAFEVDVEALQPESRFAWRWHPYAVDPQRDYSDEPTTLVEFTLVDSGDGGTVLNVVESGFERIPDARRDEAWRMNNDGWEQQMRNIHRHLQQEP